MLKRSSGSPFFQNLENRTVGVVERNDEKIQRGYVLFNGGQSSYLVDEDGRVIHEWVSERNVFSSVLAENGDLIRDGCDVEEAPLFATGGAAGVVERVSWDGELIWRFIFTPFHEVLTHHNVELLPNGNVLALVWRRVSKEEALKMGRRPELIPDGEVWWNEVVEIAPVEGTKTAKVVWSWTIADWLVQDFDEKKENFGDVGIRLNSLDINSCPVGGKAGQRNLFARDPKVTTDEVKKFGSNFVGKTGEKDWLHVNCCSYDPVRDQIAVSFNSHSEIVIINRNQKDDGLLYRWGNPANFRMGSKTDQKLFCQHSVCFIRGTNTPSDGNLIYFNNGRVPDREWSTIEEIALPEKEKDSGVYEREEGKPFGPEGPCWSYGSKKGRKDSFYCTHISSCQRLSNGNTLITQGPQGIIMEITPKGEEVWRYVSPLGRCGPHSSSFITTRQGQQRTYGDRFSLFQSFKYSCDYKAFEGRELEPYRYLEE